MVELTEDKITINDEQRLYVIHEDYGYSCLGFDVAYNRALAIYRWIDGPIAHSDTRLDLSNIGKPEGYADYERAMQAGAEHARKTSTRCPAELTPQLIGLEGKRVEVITPDGERSRFYVGKSGGWCPVHLEIKQRNSSGGGAVYFPQGSTVRVIEGKTR